MTNFSQVTPDLCSEASCSPSYSTDTAHVEDCHWLLDLISRWPPLSAQGLLWHFHKPSPALVQPGHILQLSPQPCTEALVDLPVLKHRRTCAHAHTIIALPSRGRPYPSVPWIRVCVAVYITSSLVWLCCPQWLTQWPVSGKCSGLYLWPHQKPTGPSSGKNHDRTFTRTAVF